MNKYKTERIMSDHKNNLRRAIGLDRIDYEYGLDWSETLQVLNQRTKDLGYPLRVEPKRDRVVLNAEALEKILEATMESIVNKAIQEIEQYLYQDINDFMISNLNSIIFNDGHFESKQTKPNKSLNRFINKLASSLVNEIMNVIRDTLQM